MSSFSKFGAKAWNAIPTHFKQNKYDNFKKRLQILKNQDEYLEPLTILQLAFSSVFYFACKACILHFHLFFVIVLPN